MTPPAGFATHAQRLSSRARSADSRALRHLRATAAIHTVGMGCLAVDVTLGGAPLWPSVLLAAFVAGGLLLFYALLHSGVTRHLQDPALLFPQTVFSIGCVSLSYALIDESRGLALQWLCLIVAFGMRRLDARQLRLAAALAVALPVAAVVARWLAAPVGFDLATELLYLAMAGLIVPVLLVVSSHAQTLQRRKLAQRGELVQAVEQLREVAALDGLTGLFNRQQMQAHLAEEVRRHARSSVGFCVAMLDLDWFKQVNDRYGHATGDAVLREFAMLARQLFDGRPDTVARWGGEEFLVLMPGATVAQALAALQALRERVHRHDWHRLHRDLAVSFSAGVAEHAHGAELADTLGQADQSLYRAKEEGRDRIGPAATSGEPPAPGLADRRWACSARNYPQAAAVPPPAPAAPATAARRRRGPAWLQWLSDLLLGSDAALRKPTFTVATACSVQLAWSIAIVWWVIPAGVVEAHLGVGFLAFTLSTATVPYLLVRSGLTANWRDPAFTAAHIVWAEAGIAVAYAMVPGLRPLMLQLSCQAVMFGFIAFRPGVALRVGALSIAFLLASLASLFWFQPADFLPRREGMQVLLSAFILGLLTYHSHTFSLLRERVRTDKRQLQTMSERLREMMSRDPLTGLPNRQHMHQVLRAECGRQERSGEPFYVALIDLDHFKTINDRHGHQAGDEALIGFAEIARKKLRESDFVGRWGGEEFLVVVTHPNTPGGALQALERLREAVAAARPCASEPDLRVTFSAGLAIHAPGESIERMIERADEALYEAKRQGRNRCVPAC